MLGASTDDVPLGIRFDLANEQLAARVVADRDEHAGDVQHAVDATDRVLEPNASDLAAVTEDLGDDRVPDDLDLFVRERAIDHDLAGAELVATVDDRHRVGEPGQERRLLHRGVTATDNDDVLAAEEEAVTGCTG